MTTITFLHTSDWQLGMERWFLPPEAQARFDQARIDAIRTLDAAAVDHGCSFILVAGDVFEHNSLAEHTTGRALEALASLRTPVWLLPGNHDPLTAANPFYGACTIPGVGVLADDRPVEIAPGVELVGAPLTARYASEDLAARALSALDPTPGIRILAAHGQVLHRGGEPAPGLMDLGTLEDALARRVIDYVALGDTHSAQSVGETGRIRFSGAPETTDYHDLDSAGGGEDNSGTALVVTVSVDDDAPDSPAEVTVEQIDVGTWTFEAVGAEINSADDVAAFIARLEAYPEKARTVIKYALRGSVDLSTWQRLESELARLQPRFASLRERPRLMDLTVSPGDDELRELRLSGYAAGAWDELLAAALGTDTTSADPVARDALRLLHRFADKDH
ncbi:metallophosphoesterase family protein [Corynebacterium pygosceleis]|uniref:Metallophosphoesterase n=1 Tax=Corynebacterium pygosceleis TaxID=2800406 RepID=A0A9Q4CAX8_9CORY|nr:metallophosphoesterase [Corynebacterium pygosceleis]MCK7637944.1 metallophosphoesterase [Corynebacterium pygosceleis]MCK7675659.1 metallophosphoesterase [Corynebacterium pygosceleis]MCL0120947.1 metallophosphoesterase [Corynebacterium pygosceleis]MCX7444516.1 metallophosphoesterase [Corynebacterium pygosceleis]MCX7468660.1 metallophosphoesterase [Corynebacterium pygosceleis]